MATFKDTFADGNTVIGQSILISGKLAGDEDLTVRGRVEGEITLTKTLIVEISGVVKANVAVKNAIVSGVVVGNINATESVELTKEGRMVGDIRAPRVIIVDGASFRGRVDMGEVQPGRLPDRTVPRPTIRPQVARPSAPPAKPPSPPARPAPSAPSRPVQIEAKKGAPTPPPRPESRPTPPPPSSVAVAAKKKVVIKKR